MLLFNIPVFGPSIAYDIALQRSLYSRQHSWKSHRVGVVAVVVVDDVMSRDVDRSATGRM